MRGLVGWAGGCCGSDSDRKGVLGSRVAVGWCNAAVDQRVRAWPDVARRSLRWQDLRSTTCSRMISAVTGVLVVHVYMYQLPWRVGHHNHIYFPARATPPAPPHDASTPPAASKTAAEAASATGAVAAANAAYASTAAATALSPLAAVDTAAAVATACRRRGLCRRCSLPPPPPPPKSGSMPARECIFMSELMRAHAYVEVAAAMAAAAAAARAAAAAMATATAAAVARRDSQATAEVASAAAADDDTGYGHVHGIEVCMTCARYGMRATDQDRTKTRLKTDLKLTKT